MDRNHPAQDKDQRQDFFFWTRQYTLGSIKYREIFWEDRISLTESLLKKNPSFYIYSVFIYLPVKSFVKQ